MAKRIYVQYRGQTIKPFSLMGFSGVFQPSGPSLLFPEEVANRLIEIIPECVFTGSINEETPEVAPPVPVINETDEDLVDGDDTEETEEGEEAYVDEDVELATKPAPKAPAVVLAEGEVVPDDTFTKEDILAWFKAHNLKIDPSFSKKRLLTNVKKAIGG